jgi:hypothetical protein
MVIATKQHIRKQTTPKAPAARTSVAKPQPTATRNVAKMPPAKTQAVRRQEAISSAHRTRPIVLPEKSRQAAMSVFENFNPSRFATDTLPANYVPTEKTAAGVHRVASAKQVQEFQTRALEQHLRKIRKMETPNRGLTLALSTEMRKKLLPSFNAKTETVDLKEVMNVIEKNMRGTEFFSKGHPVLNRLVLRARAKEILAGMRKGKR